LTLRVTLGSVSSADDWFDIAFDITLSDKVVACVHAMYVAAMYVAVCAVLDKLN
jgi:hypothetical protein